MGIMQINRKRSANPPCRSVLILAGLLALALLAGCGGRGGPAIKAQAQSISFAAAPALTLNGSATVSATASSGLAVSYSSATPTVCSVDSASGVVAAIATGACIIAADQPGNSEFSPAPQATQSISVAINPVQTLGFAAAPALAIYGTATVAASASSGLAVSYSSITPAVCAVDAVTGVVTDIAAGACTVAANQAGDGYYFAAPQVTQTLAVAAWPGTLTVPGAPAAVKATAGTLPGSVTVSFTGPASSGGSPITGYSVTSNPAGITAAGTASPLTLTCPSTCAGYSFAVTATNSVGNSTASAPAEVLTRYNVTLRFYEPDTQPNDSIFTGSFTFNSTTGTVSNLAGKLASAVTGPPMLTVPLAYQLSAVADGQGGLLVSAFALNSTNTFSEGGFAPGSPGLYYGYPAAKNPAAGGTGNAYVTIYVNLANPAAALTAAQINRLAYADCTAGGMMGDVCMTGYSGIGTMGGFPVSQTVTQQ